MAKVCWNCGEYHPNNAVHCPFCGASLEGGNKNLMDNLIGLFTFQEDEKIRINFHFVIPAVIFIVAIVAIAAFVLSEDHVETQIPQLYGIRYHQQSFSVLGDKPL